MQRVKWAEVEVEGRIVGRIKAGALVLLGVHHTDTEAEARWLAQKLAHLRLFEDDQGKLNRSIGDIGGAMLVVSNFTLYGDCRKGRRPSFTDSARYEQGEALYRQFCEYLRKEGVPVQTGIYGAQMQVRLQNDGPITLLLETPSQSTQITAVPPP